MNLRTGNMFAHPASLILVTTNSYVRSDGTLVMGRGAALDLRRRWPEAESVFGYAVSNPHNRKVCISGYQVVPYGVIVAHPPANGQLYGIFQVKYHWGKPALPELIEYSVDKLISIAHQYQSIYLNYPGIGNGGLTREVVGPLIERLPGNVTVWER